MRCWPLRGKADDSRRRHGRHCRHAERRQVESSQLPASKRPGYRHRCAGNDAGCPRRVDFFKRRPVCLVDTAGIRETEDRVEQIGVTKARSYMDKADITVVVIDRSRPLSEEDKGILASTTDKNALIVLNKLDLPAVVSEGDLRDYHHPVLSISASTGEGLEALKDQLLEQALPRTNQSGSALLTNTRHIELVRQSREALNRALTTMEDGMPVDFAVVDLREAWSLLGSITGDTVHDDIVEEIFSRFCLGK